MTSSTNETHDNSKLLLPVIIKTLLLLAFVGIFVFKILDFYKNSLISFALFLKLVLGKIVLKVTAVVKAILVVPKKILALIVGSVAFVLNVINSIIFVPKRLYLAIRAKFTARTTRVKKKKKGKKAKKLQKPARVGLLTKFAFFAFGLFFAVVGVLIPMEANRWFRQLPQPELLLAANHNSTKILDKKGRLLYEIYNDKQYEYVTLNKIPHNLVAATIATEDANFYQHHGVQPVSIVRAAKATFLDSEVQGASTITQQLIKNVLLTPEQTYTRKIKEASIAVMVERKYSKDQIMELYLNNTPYGGTAWGVQAASKKFFDKDVWDLDLAESSMIAGLPLSPTEYNPFNDPVKAKARQKFVLATMVDQGIITKTEADEAYAKELTFSSQKEYIRAPHFVNFVRDELIQKYGQRMVEVEGLTVTTTLDLDLQEKVQEIVAYEVENSAGLNITNGAAVVADVKNNEILAYVGSKNYFATDYDGEYDIARAFRQPGSSIKPLAYAMALEDGMTPASIINDSPIAINTGSEVYKPVNYDGAFHGNVSLRSALANSYNIPAVKLSVKLGPDNIVATGKKAGLTGWEVDGSYGYSIVLGGKETRLIDMTNLYSVFARNGSHKEFTGIKSVKDSKGFEIYDDSRRETSVFSDGVTYLISSILSDNGARTPAFGPNSALVVENRKNVAVKTGTTDLKKDNWTIGYTPSYVAGVWVGNNNGDPMSQNLASGLSGAAPIWNKIMLEVLAGVDDEAFVRPETVVSKSYKECNNTTEVFITGTEPDTICKKLKKDGGERRNDRN